eukprot:COSAG01_NODE_34961_length_539_cov_0.945455_1_plen_39_part_01
MQFLAFLISMLADPRRDASGAITGVGVRWTISTPPSSTK